MRFSGVSDSMWVMTAASASLVTLNTSRSSISARFSLYGPSSRPSSANEFPSRMSKIATSRSCSMFELVVAVDFSSSVMAMSRDFGSSAGASALLMTGACWVADGSRPTGGVPRAPRRGPAPWRPAPAQRAPCRRASGARCAS